MITAKFSVGDLVDVKTLNVSFFGVSVIKKMHITNRMVRCAHKRHIYKYSGWLYKVSENSHWVLEEHIRPHNPPEDTEDTAYTAFKSTLDLTPSKEGEIA